MELHTFTVCSRRGRGEKTLLTPLAIYQAVCGLLHPRSWLPFTFFPLSGTFHLNGRMHTNSPLLPWAGVGVGRLMSVRGWSGYLAAPE